MKEREKNNKNIVTNDSTKVDISRSKRVEFKIMTRDIKNKDSNKEI